MRFANLLWALLTDGRPHYRIAAAIGCSEARFSRCFTGRATFTEDEKTRLAVVLGYSEPWLFQVVKRKVRLNRNRQRT
jgi:plasmid maintenance system antidote protein VapI